jgi:hypothetical protein
MKSPLKSKPLRNPGQSVDEHIVDFITEDFIPYLLATAAFILLTTMEWLRWATNRPPSPIMFTIIAIFALLVTARKFVVGRKKIRALRLGRDGEKAVGQYLESLGVHSPKLASFLAVLDTPQLAAG